MDVALLMIEKYQAALQHPDVYHMMDSHADINADFLLERSASNNILNH
jgi:hypothetical protein